MWKSESPAASYDIKLDGNEKAKYVKVGLDGNGTLHLNRSPFLDPRINLAHEAVFDDCTSHFIQRVHDLRLVWSSQVFGMEVVGQTRLGVDRLDQLGHRIFEYCFQVPRTKSVTRETGPIQSLAIESSSGSDNAGCLHDLYDLSVQDGNVPNKPCYRLRISGLSGVLHLQKVKFASPVCSEQSR